MTFTYKISSADNDELIIARARLAINDQSEDKGPRPDGTNFSDEEILSVYTDEGSDEGRVQARLLEILSGAWAGTQKTMFGSLIDPTRTSRDYAAAAMKLREQHGYGSGAAAGFSIQMTNPEPAT